MASINRKSGSSVPSEAGNSACEAKEMTWVFNNESRLHTTKDSDETPSQSVKQNLTAKESRYR